MTFALTILAGVFALAVGFLLPAVSHRIRDKHRHGPWVIIGRHYEPPTDGKISARGFAVEELGDLLYGYTTVTERCDDPDCHLVRTRQVRGRLTDNVVESL